MNTFAEDVYCSFGGTNNFLYTFLHVHGNPTHTYTYTFEAFDVFECVYGARLVVWYYGAYYANEAQSFCGVKNVYIKVSIVSH